jgi:hypothetical protein
LLADAAAVLVAEPALARAKLACAVFSDLTRLLRPCSIEPGCDGGATNQTAEEPFQHIPPGRPCGQGACPGIEPAIVHFLLVSHVVSPDGYLTLRL